MVLIFHDGIKFPLNIVLGCFIKYQYGTKPEALRDTLSDDEGTRRVLRVFVRACACDEN